MTVCPYVDASPSHLLASALATFTRLLVSVVLGTMVTTPALAQFSNCQAIANRLPVGGRVVHVATEPASDYTVEIRYVGHSTFRITAPDGTTIATDYAGSAGSGPRPDIVTMNHAHSSHWTAFPDPAIPHVLRGWGSAGARAEHLLTVGEVLVRNVATDIRSHVGIEEHGNSIFIFEIQGLCIGHLGHLHQPLSDAQFAEVGRLDVVFVPIDGTYTMNHTAMMEVVSRLRASIAIPMHWFSNYTLADFVARTRQDGLHVEMPAEAVLKVSLNTLPDLPTLIVLPRHTGR